MSEMQDYKSSLTDTSSRKFETFSYLPAMTSDGIKKQVEYLVKQGLNPAIEHTEPENAFDHYWYMGFAALLSAHAAMFVLGPGDAILLPSHGTEDCCWHSVFALGRTASLAHSYGIFARGRGYPVARPAPRR